MLTFPLKQTLSSKHYNDLSFQNQHKQIFNLESLWYKQKVSSALEIRMVHFLSKEKCIPTTYMISGSKLKQYLIWKPTLESGIDIGQGISIGPGKFVKKNKRRALNKHRAWTKCANLCYKKPIKLENICRPWEKFQNLINVGPLIRL